MKSLLNILKAVNKRKLKRRMKKEKFIECSYAEHTHEEITIGSHVCVYPKLVAEQYKGVKRDKTRYLKRVEKP